MKNDGGRSSAWLASRFRIILHTDIHQKRSGQAEMQFLLQMCYAPTVCHDTLPVTLRLSNEVTNELKYLPARPSRYKVIPHGSTALTDHLPPISHISHLVGALPPGGVHSVGITTITISQIDFANPLCLSLVPHELTDSSAHRPCADSAHLAQ